MSTHGGPRPGAGRKPISNGHQTRRVSVRLPDADRVALLRLGCGSWVRKHLDAGTQALPRESSRKGPTSVVSLSMSETQHTSWCKLGAAAWLRGLLAGKAAAA